jgi:peptidoglycan/LPS O-acetylase OafA/YrhL
MSTARKTFLLATGLIALHVADDTFIQPPAGTEATDHLAAGLIPLALLGLAAYVHGRARAGIQAALALLAGVFGLAAGLEALHYPREVGPSGDDFTGLLSLPAGLALLALGAGTLWRARRLHERPFGATGVARSWQLPRSRPRCSC